MKFYNLPFFKNQLRKLKFHQNQAGLTGTLHKNQYTFVILTRSFLLRMIIFSDKFVEKIKRHVLRSVTPLPPTPPHPPKIVPFVR